MSDNSSVDFTMRLINQVSAPANQVQSSMALVEKAFKSARKAVEAPAAKRGALSDWDKMVAKAKLSQAKDFAAQQAKLNKATEQGGSGGLLSGILGELAPAAVAGGAIGTIIAAIASIAGAAKAGVETVFELGKSFLGAAYDAAKFSDSATLAIGYLTNNAPRAAAQFDDVRHMAQGLGLDVNETVGSFERLLAMQFTVGKSKDLIKMASDMQAIGANAEEVQRILYAISEIKSMGTLQKRQERMLQMAGISGSLIDAALMKKTGITDKSKLDKARSKNKIGADVAIDAIMEAVMHKTHESKLGAAGKAFADQTLVGMENQLTAGIQNWFTSIGELMKPGFTDLMHMVTDLFGSLMTDPQLQDLGKFLLNEFELFVNWSKENWPVVKIVALDAVHAIGDGLRFVVECFDASTEKGKLLYGYFDLIGQAAVMTFNMVVAPAIEFIGVLDATDAALKRVHASMKDLGIGLLLANPVVGLPVLSGSLGQSLGGDLAKHLGDPGPTSATALDGARVSSFLDAVSGVIPVAKTEAGKESASRRSVTTGDIHITVPAPDGQEPHNFAARVHSEFIKLLQEHGG